MVSTRTFRAVIWTARVAYHLGAFPAVWDSSMSRWIVKYGPTIKIPCFTFLNFQLGKVFPCIYILLQALNMIYLVVVLNFLNPSDRDKIICWNLLLICLAVNFFILLEQVLHFENFCSWMNKFLTLDVQMRKSSVRRG